MIDKKEIKGISECSWEYKQIMGGDGRKEEAMKGNGNKTKSDELSKRIAAIRKKAGGDTHNEVLDVYLEGYTDGYNAAVELAEKA